MGQIANDMIEGRCCALCGQYFIDLRRSKDLQKGEEYAFEHGIPVACDDCWEKDCGYEKQSSFAVIL